MQEIDYKKYVPYLYLHANEKYRPISIEEYITSCDAFHNGQFVGPATMEMINTSNDYLKLQTRQDWAKYEYKTATCYAMHRKLPNNDLIQIEFYYLFGYNPAYKPLCIDKCVSQEALGAHGEDWENVILHVNLRGELVRAFFSSHKFKDGYWREACDLRLKDGRVVVYSALNSHGMYDNSGCWPRFWCCANDYTSDSVLVDLDVQSVDQRFNMYQEVPMFTEVYDNLKRRSNNACRRFFCCFQDVDSCDCVMDACLTKNN